MIHELVSMVWTVSISPFSMQTFQELLSTEFFGNSVQSYLLAIITAVGVYVIFRFFIFLIIKGLEKAAKKTKTDLDDAVIQLLSKRRWLVFWLVLISTIQYTLDVSEKTASILSGLFNVFLVLLGIRIINFWIQFGAKKFLHSKADDTEKISIEFLTSVVRIVVWLLGALFLLSSFGYNISSLIAGLGIGGVAVALAVQDVLGDLLSCLSIYIDKPFKVGDTIQVGTQIGTVKKIGLKTTRVTSLQGEEIVFSNHSLTSGEINNFGKLKKRRVVTSLGVTYETPVKKMEQIPAWLEVIIDKVEDVTFDRAHFSAFGDFSKNFELVYFVESKDYVTYMDRLQEINLEIHKKFDKEKVEFAFPSQTIYVQK